MSTHPTHASAMHGTELGDTDETIARAIHDRNDTHDHMGRRHAVSLGDAFRMDLPWIAGVLLLIVFLVGALAGFWGR
ncbi:hypothetical protein [Falsiroseomonas sp. CW058]|uniref:hypothetical protein n=1 Tax=Falsiroseomonas sp. CW058 TaxID=3388664 RepID=UPI003D31FD97